MDAWVIYFEEWDADSGLPMRDIEAVCLDPNEVEEAVATVAAGILKELGRADGLGYGSIERLLEPYNQSDFKRFLDTLSAARLSWAIGIKQIKVIPDRSPAACPQVH